MYIGNAILLILNLPLRRHVREPAAHSLPWLVAVILVVSIIGVYSVNFTPTDIWIMVISGLAGYLLRKFGYEMAPLLLALVLGDRLEENFRMALTMSGGSYATFADQYSGAGGDLYPRPPPCGPGIRLALRLSQILRQRGQGRLSDTCACDLFVAQSSPGWSMCPWVADHRALRRHLSPHVSVLRPGERDGDNACQTKKSAGGSLCLICFEQ